MPRVRARKTSLNVSRRSHSRTPRSTSSSRARTRGTKSGGTSSFTPPMRMKLCIMRAPVTDSNMFWMRSRSRNPYMMGVIAPRSMA